MVLPEIASILAIANYSIGILSKLKKKKKKKAPVRRKPKKNKEAELVAKLLTNPEEALKEMGAAYVVKNHKKILKKIEKRVLEEFE